MSKTKLRTGGNDEHNKNNKIEQGTTPEDRKRILHFIEKAANNELGKQPKRWH